MNGFEFFAVWEAVVFHFHEFHLQDKISRMMFFCDSQFDF